MASSDMDSKQSETFLASQVKKKDSNFSESQAKVMLKFWRNHKDRVHESLAQRCIWSDKLKNLSWRIDIQSKGKHVEQINVPTAIVELQLENNTQEEMSEISKVVQFEMDEQSMDKMLQQLKDVEREIKKFSCQDS